MLHVPLKNPPTVQSLETVAS